MGGERERARRERKLALSGGAVSAARAVLAAMAAAGSGGCQDEPLDATPEKVVEALIDRMQRIHGDIGRAREGYELLWSEAKQNLAERARHASALIGRPISPEEMIAPSRFTLHFKPKRYSAEIQGQWATVELAGDQPAERSTVRCVQEDGRWRVVVALPPVPPIEKREEIHP